MAYMKQPETLCVKISAARILNQRLANNIDIELPVLFVLLLSYSHFIQQLVQVLPK